MQSGRRRKHAGSWVSGSVNARNSNGIGLRDTWKLEITNRKTFLVGQTRMLHVESGMKAVTCEVTKFEYAAVLMMNDGKEWAYPRTRNR